VQSDSNEVRPDTGKIEYIDQLRNVINKLREKPDDRRLVVTAWEPGAVNRIKIGLPPCHLLFIFNTQYDENGKPLLCLHLTQRSCDVALGIPFNIASYALLLRIVASQVGMTAGFFSHVLVDAHIYVDQVEGLKEQLLRTPKQRPTVLIQNKDIDELKFDDIQLLNYKCDPGIKFPVAV